MKKPLLLGGIVSILLSNSGCTHSPKRTALHDFGVISPVSTQQTQSPIKPMITVNAPTWLWDNRIRYRLLYSAPTHVRFYGLDLWVASPPELFEQYMLDNARTVAYPLVIRLLDFEQQFDNPTQARVVLRFSVEAYSTDHQQHKGVHLFNLALPTQTADAEGAIAGFAALMQQVALKVQQWVAGLN